MKYLSFLFVLITFSSFAQSPWVRDKGAGYVQLGYSSISNYGSIYDKSATNGIRTTERVISDRTLSVYGEYGITPKFTVLSSIPAKFLNSGELRTPDPLISPITESGNLTGLGNVSLGGRYALIQKNWVLSGQLNVSGNSGSYDNQTGLRTALPAWSIEPMISAGKGGSNYYYFGYAGVGLRTNDHSHFGHLGGEVGLDFNKRVWLILFVDAVFSFRNGTIAASPANLQTGLYLNDQEYIAFGPKVIVEAIPEKLGFTFSIGGGVSNNLVPAQAATSLGLYYKWK